jgi:hypothetical protein
MNTRFELEQALQELWQVAYDLKIVYEGALDGELEGEELCNVLMGIEKMHMLRCQRADDIFEDLIKNGRLT